MKGIVGRKIKTIPQRVRNSVGKKDYARFKRHLADPMDTPNGHFIDVLFMQIRLQNLYLCSIKQTEPLFEVEAPGLPLFRSQ